MDMDDTGFEARYLGWLTLEVDTSLEHWGIIAKHDMDQNYAMDTVTCSGDPKE
jgi:hypothetical protein